MGPVRVRAHQRFDRLDTARPEVGAVAACVALEWEVDPDTGAVRECMPGVMAAFSLLTIAADLVNPIRLQL